MRLGISPGKFAFPIRVSYAVEEWREALISHPREAVAACLEEARKQGIEPAAVGLATAGWVDSASGRVVYATENLPGWTRADLVTRLRETFGLPVAVENDANALAIAEKHFGAAKSARDFVCMTLGTGVGGGVYVGGHLNHGHHFLGNALGHVPIEPGDRSCTCGLSGCLEAYTNAAALLRYAAAGNYSSAEQVIAAAYAGDSTAPEATRTYARFPAMGCAAVVSLLDPELLILGDGLSQNNPLLASRLTEDLGKRVMVWKERKLEIVLSSLGYSAGVLGAAALASSLLPEIPGEKYQANRIQD